MTPGEVLVSPGGLRGFDCNTPVDASAARALYAHGYRFALRYVRRAKASANDLSASELDRLLCAGLAAMPVQHVESERSWLPSESKGEVYGNGAAQHAREIGFPSGVTVWCDLEGVSATVSASIVDRYCRTWWHTVKGAGYEPGLYVGWHAGLSAVELYRLPFTKYWAAYNLNADQAPANVGVMMKQHAARADDLPAGVEFAIDTDTITGDALGRFPTLFAPDGWPT